MQNVYSKKANDISGIEILKKMENKTLSKKENEIIFEELGEYSTLPHNQYLEVFAETITKFICNSLQNCQLKSDPFEKFNNTHKEFQKIFHKVCTFE